MVKCPFPYTHASKTQRIQSQYECYIGKPKSKHENECKHSSALWMNDFFIHPMYG
jgi:hypothetical protein